MKELQNIQPDKTELHAIKPVKKQINVHQFRPKAGQIVWEINLETRIISPAEYQEEAAIYESAVQGMGGVKKKLITKENHLYCAAINAKNADKKFFKALGLKYPKDSKPKIKV